MRKRKRGKKRTGYYIDLGRLHRLLYTLDSLEIITIKTDVRFKDFLTIDVKDLPLLIWAGLIWEDPDLTIKEVERMIQEKTQDNEIAKGHMAFTALSAAKDYEKDQEFREAVFRKRGE